jgi:hypothetical protein
VLAQDAWPGPTAGTPIFFLDEWLRSLFWLEAIAQAAFGAAWLIKGETFLKDRAI